MSHKINITAAVPVLTYLLTASKSGNMRARRVNAIPSLNRSALKPDIKKLLYH